MSELSSPQTAPPIIQNCASYPPGVRPAPSFSAPSTYLSQLRLSPCLLIIPTHSISRSSRTTSRQLLRSDRLLTVVSGVCFSYTSHYLSHPPRRYTTMVSGRPPPLCHANYYLNISWHSRSTQRLALCVFICPFYLSELSVRDPPASMMPSPYLSVWNNDRSMNSVIISSYPFSFISPSCLVANIPFVVPLPFLNSCCASPIYPSTTALCLLYKLLSRIFNI